MSLSDLTSPTAIKLAIEECDRLGRERFLNRYGFGHAREYTLRYQGREYDSKAIVGVAHGYQFPSSGPLKSEGFSGGIASSGAAAKAFELGFKVEGKQRRSIDWTLEQCEAAAEVYFRGLHKKLAGQPFNRAEALRTLEQKTDKSHGSVDRKFQNIDAVLFKNQLPRMMDGIAPKFQHLLELVVLDPLARHNSVFETVSEQPPSITNTGGLLVEPPNVSAPVSGNDEPSSQIARKIDYAKRDANNRRLGRAGEQWVVAFEKKRLTEIGLKDLAEQVDWIADRLGDGLGYDIVSFDENRTEIFLEVKTTNAGILTPFFISPNEIAVAERERASYRLYRVFDFSTSPRAYVLTGPLKHKLTLKPQVYSAMPIGSDES